MRINHNIASLNSYRQLTANTAASSKSLEKLSSGLRITKAGDDAAGLAISEKMRGQIRGLGQASRNAQDGISMIQTAEGGLSETHAMLQRMRELVVQANNDTNNADDRAAIQKEVDELNNEITNIANKTTFNTKDLLNGTLGVKNDTSGGSAINIALAARGATVTFNGVASGVSVTINATSQYVEAVNGGVTQRLTAFDATTVAAGAVMDFDKIGLKITIGGAGSITAGNATKLVTSGTTADFQIGANQSTVLSISISDMKATAIGNGGGTLTSVSQVNVTTVAFNENVKSIDQAIKDVSVQRAQLGAWQNRLEHTISNLDASSENLTAAESRVRDADMAKEMMEFTKNNILNQAATAMLAQANQQPQGVLQLLR